MRRERVLAAVGMGGLVALALMYALTYEQAARVDIAWRGEVTPERQAQLEARYLLTNPRDRTSDQPPSISYDLLDTSARNLRAIVNNPEIARKDDIDPDRHVLRGHSPGERGTWIGRRIPWIRDARVLGALLAALMVIAVAGVVRMGAARRRGAAALRPTAGDGDIFDGLSARLSWIRPHGVNAPARGGSGLLTRLTAAVAVPIVIGVPILQAWEALFCATLLLAVVFGTANRGWWRAGAAVALVVSVVLLKGAVPRADIAEAHNAFLLIGEGEALEKGLPADVFSSWKAQFDTLYPAGAVEEPPPAYSWRGARVVPTSLFTRSSDALWRAPKYTRQVDAINFRSLAEFRGGFANDLSYNFWEGDISRQTMPFYAMYELTPSSVGSRLAWRGQVFWERRDGGFDEIVHQEVASRAIEPHDAGRRVYAAFFPSRDDQMEFRFGPSGALRVSAAFEALLSIAGGLAVLLITIRPRWDSYARVLSIFLAGYLAISAWGAGEHLGTMYGPHGGGDDGLVHDSHGREMAALAADGHIVEALQGLEPVYWFTPGMRYMRMLEKLLFGDTNHLYALLLPCILVVVFYLMRRLADVRWAWATTAVCAFLPIANPSFAQYVSNARVGYGEALGGGLLLFGLLVTLRAISGSGGPGAMMAASGGAALAGSMFVRPNFTLVVVWLGLVYLAVAVRRKALREGAAFATGLALALWMPFHNWYYGGEWYLISRSGASVAVTLGVGDYAAAAGDVLRGRFDTPAVTAILAQLQGWLVDPGFVVHESLQPFAWAAHPVRVVALVVTAFIALSWIVRRRAGESELGIVAVASLLAHLPMLFVFATYPRYAMLGWDLSVLVFLAWIACRHITSSGRQRHAHLPIDERSAPHAYAAPGSSGC